MVAMISALVLIIAEGLQLGGRHFSVGTRPITGKWGFYGYRSECCVQLFVN
jgi:hypothetical protein